MSAIETCRTAALGGHVERCEDCAHERDRLQLLPQPPLPEVPGAPRRGNGSKTARRSSCRFPTITSSSPCRPRSAPIAFQNKAAVYDLLFRTAAETLTTIAADPKHLGARIGLTAVLHTWGSALTHHPHVHVIVPGGGLSPDGSRWIACKPGFFLPVRVLSRLFRRLFLEGLAALHAAGRLAFLGELAPARRPARLRRRARAVAPLRLGRLRQETLRRTASRPRLSLPLHPSRRDLRTPGSSRSTKLASPSSGRTTGSKAATGSRP